MNKKQNEFFILRAIRGQMRGVNFLKGVIYRMEFLKGFLGRLVRWWKENNSKYLIFPLKLLK